MLARAACIARLSEWRIVAENRERRDWSHSPGPISRTKTLQINKTARRYSIQHKRCTQTAIKFLCPTYTPMESSRGNRDCTDAPEVSNDMMDDSKHQDAVLAAAEVFERSHQFSVSSLKAPAARALTVEAVMDVANSILWPESDREQPVEMDDIDEIRAESVSGGAKNRKMR